MVKSTAMEKKDRCANCPHSFSAKCRTCPENGPQSIAEGVIWLVAIVAIVFVLATLFA